MERIAPPHVHEIQCHLDYLGPRDREAHLEGPALILVWLGAIVLGWVLVLGAVKALLQLCGLWL